MHCSRQAVCAAGLKIYSFCNFENNAAVIVQGSEEPKRHHRSQHYPPHCTQSGCIRGAKRQEE